MPHTQDARDPGARRLGRTASLGALQVLITGVILGALMWLWGPENFTDAVTGLPWWSFGAAGLVLLTLAPLAGVGCLLGALIAVLVASRWLRRLTPSEILQVAVLSVLGWACFAILFMVAAAVLAPSAPASVLPSSAAVALAGMSLPVGVGGWGVRETAAAWSFSLSDLTATDGVRVSVGYGVLALASTAPGAVILALRLVPRLRGARRFVSKRPKATD